MRLYSRTGQTVLNDPEYGTFEPGPDGGFDLPEDLAERQRRFHVDKQPLWETDIGRQERLIAEEMERRKDPLTMLKLMEQMVAATQATAAAAQGAQAPVAKTSKPRKSAASSTPPAE